jgi:hypothetical protein
MKPLVALLKQTIAADPFQLSPRVRTLRAILDKLQPPTARPRPHPAPKPAGTVKSVAGTEEEATALGRYERAQASAR